jgi:hypothetical protein
MGYQRSRDYWQQSTTTLMKASHLYHELEQKLPRFLGNLLGATIGSLAPTIFGGICRAGSSTDDNYPFK